MRRATCDAPSLACFQQLWCECNAGCVYVRCKSCCNAMQSKGSAAINFVQTGAGVVLQFAQAVTDFRLEMQVLGWVLAASAGFATKNRDGFSKISFDGLKQSSSGRLPAVQASWSVGESPWPVVTPSISRHTAQKLQGSPHRPTPARRLVEVVRATTNSSVPRGGSPRKAPRAA